MLPTQKKIYLIRHGETEWTLSGQHTGVTDIPLTKNGENEAKKLSERLQGHSFAAVFTSPLQRAMHTCKIAGLSKKPETDQDLVEWNYGDFEGLTSEEIKKKHPQWNLFLEGAPHGESIYDVEKRADRVLSKIRSFQGDVALFSHGHFLRTLTARWLQLSASDGKLFALHPASLSILGYERIQQVLLLWNDISHLHQ